MSAFVASQISRPELKSGTVSVVRVSVLPAPCLLTVPSLHLQSRARSRTAQAHRPLTTNSTARSHDVTLANKNFPTLVKNKNAIFHRFFTD